MGLPHEANFEANFEAEHPEVATALNNLTTLLQDTNRLGEAELLMRQAVVILLAFTRDTGHRTYKRYLQTTIRCC